MIRIQCRRCGFADVVQVLPAVRRCPAAGDGPPERCDFAARRGLGDWLARLLAAVGITPRRYCRAKAAIGLRPECGCKRRQEKLNQLLRGD